MREQLTVMLATFPKAKIVDGTAEATTLADHSVDVITCAQAIGWFDLEAFRIECSRIGKPGAIVISLCFRLFVLPSRRNIAERV